MQIDQINVTDKKVLIRVDFNVPLNENQEITDDTRIKAALPTLKHILDRNGSPIIMSHLGRPGKDKNEDGSIKRNKFSLVHVIERLQELTGTKVHFIDDTVGHKVEEAAKALPPGEILLLENTRFYGEEKKGDKEFALQLSKLANVYVNDAFGTAHRAHASTATVAQFFGQGEKAFGYLMQKELDSAKRITEAPARPFVAILGGAKVSDKIDLVMKLLEKVDRIIIGGGMAYTFIAAQGGKIGNSLLEADKMELARNILSKAEEKGVKIDLPQDSICAKEFKADAEYKAFPSNEIPDGWMGLDIGQKALKEAATYLDDSKTIFWNGPMGVFEFDAFSKGTYAVAEMVAQATDKGAFSLIGGGDSVAAVNKSGLSGRVSFISTGGGAMLTLVEGKELPGINAIKD